ncbi:MAG: hypothetical protein N4A59_00395 [Marinifilum sp.]|jgi:hypothetical protein|nr:hypothetical protein [Marinifilum sp.]
MLADLPQNNSSGKLTEGIEIDSSIRSVIEFIEIHFADFSTKVKGEISASEKSLTDKLCKHLNRKASAFPFYFQHENVENHASGNSPQTDIGTLSDSEQLIVGDRCYNEFDSFFSMEAKRLPTPGQNREKEYVIGHEKPCGGIERFKKGIHGNNLRFAAIIGYIQKEDVNHWFLKINEWIGELITASPNEWKENDKLIVKEEDNEGLSKFISSNLRITEDEDNKIIDLFHFWINLTD